MTDKSLGGFLSSIAIILFLLILAAASSNLLFSFSLLAKTDIVALILLSSLADMIVAFFSSPFSVLYRRFLTSISTALGEGEFSLEP